MPNYCLNIITISHEDPKMVDQAAMTMMDGKFLEEFIPIPEELKETTAGYSDDPLQEAKDKALMEKYGYRNWHDFCVDTWGTKWDPDFQEVTVNGNQITAVFESAWSPPVAAYEKLEKLGFIIRAYYYEPGMQFAGIYEDGFDEFYNLNDYESSDEVAEDIPSELDEAFAIVESMRDWEEFRKVNENYISAIVAELTG